MQAPIGRAGGVELALAVSEAAGLGTRRVVHPLDDLRSQVSRLRRSTRAPFCVNLILDFEQEDRVDVAVAEGAPWISYSFGMNPGLVDRARAGGTTGTRTKHPE